MPGHALQLEVEAIAGGDTPQTVAQLCDTIQAEFEVERDRCVAATLDYLQGMIADELVQALAPADDGAGTAS